MTALRHQIERGLVPEDAAEMRRNADRATEVAARLEIAESGSQRCGAAARRPTWRARYVPGIVALAEDRVVALPVRGRDGDIGLAENDRPRALEPRHHDCVSRGDIVLQRRYPAGGPDAIDLVAVFDRDGNAVEGPPPIAVRASLVGGAGAGEGRVRRERDDGVELGVVLSDAGEHPGRELDRRDLSRANGVRGVERRGEIEIAHGGASGTCGQKRRGGEGQPATEELAPREVVDRHGRECSRSPSVNTRPAASAPRRRIGRRRLPRGVIALGVHALLVGPVVAALVPVARRHARVGAVESVPGRPASESGSLCYGDGASRARRSPPEAAHVGFAPIMSLQLAELNPAIGEDM